MITTRTIAETRGALRGDAPVAFVPTMGALHEGHASLIRRARELAPRVAVSIFVNPTQFAPHEDLSRYPRSPEKDLELCKREGAHTVFLPDASELYPPDEPEMVIEMPELTTILEGAHRSGHFSGVCRVVAKLFNVVRPAVACFGMKDYQQLRVVEAMVSALAMDVRIEPCPTVREPDGLAMSSRNVFLNAEQRRHAQGLFKSLQHASAMIGAGEADPTRVSQAMLQVLRAHRVEPDYAEVRDARSLQTLQSINTAIEPVVCLVSGKVGQVRLIDNGVCSSEA